MGEGRRRCVRNFSNPKSQKLFSGLSEACDFVDLAQNAFCTHPVAPLQGSFGRRFAASPTMSRFSSIHQTASQIPNPKSEKWALQPHHGSTRGVEVRVSVPCGAGRNLVGTTWPWRLSSVAALWFCAGGRWNATGRPLPRTREPRPALCRRVAFRIGSVGAEKQLSRIEIAPPDGHLGKVPFSVTRRTADRTRIPLRTPAPLTSQCP